MSEGPQLNMGASDGAGADATSRHMLEGMAVGGIFGAVGLYVLVTSLPNTLKAYFKYGQLPYAVHYPLLLVSAATPGIVFGIARNSEMDGITRFLFISTIGILCMLVSKGFGAMGNRMLREGFTWIPFAGAGRRRVGFNFSLREKLEKLGVGAWFSRLIAPAAPVQAVKASDLPALVGEGEEWVDHRKGQKQVHPTVLANFIRQTYSPAELADMPKIGGVPIPPETENNGMIFTGRSGAGKTQTFYPILQTALRKGRPGIIADAGGDYYSRLARDGFDQLFCPADPRSVKWSPFAEVRKPHDCLRIAAAAIPAGEGEDGRWAESGQKLFADCMLALWKRNERSTKKLLYYVQSATVTELQALIGTDCSSSSLLHEGNDRLLGSVRYSAAKSLNGWRHLDDEGTFSVRDWIQKAASNPKECGCLYVTHRTDIKEIHGLVTAAFQLAMVEMLTLKVDPDRRILFVLDECDSFTRNGLEGLLDFAAQARKFGGCLYLGVQVLSQLQSNLGEKTTESIIGNLASRIVLAQPNVQAAEYWSKTFGQEWVRHWKSSIGNNQSSGMTGGNLNFGKNEGLSEDITQRPVVSQGTLSDLPKLQAYIKLDGYPVAPISVEPQDIPIIREAIIFKDDDETERTGA